MALLERSYKLRKCALLVALARRFRLPLKRKSFVRGRIAGRLRVREPPRRFFLTV
jgi:hypothetical protein